MAGRVGVVKSDRSEDHRYQAYGAMIGIIIGILAGVELARWVNLEMVRVLFGLGGAFFGFVAGMITGEAIRGDFADRRYR